ncbi:M24 family metallopeptidase [Streptomyces erythrochromogenes]|uniref:M24 family metallopeptidase n=1 Tax=Streptomyces erythrochromogenes TaxID=285574 RepID=UPI00382454CE
MTVAPERTDESLRAWGPAEAARTADVVFAEVAARDLISPGRAECEVEARIAEVATEVFGHAPQPARRIVRSGPHTVLPGGQEPPDRVIRQDDIVVVDLGPFLAPHGIDAARTFAFGRDTGRNRLVEDLWTLSDAARGAFLANEHVTGRQLHAAVRTLAARAGWTLGTWHVGRLTGEAPGTDVPGLHLAPFICPANDEPLRRSVRGGGEAHWILEIHLVDAYRGFGGSLKQLLGTP